MGEQKPTTRTMEVSEVKDQLSSQVAAVARSEARIVVEESGVPVAAIISHQDLIWLQQFEQSWDEGTRALERISEAFADVPTAEMEAEIDRIITENRRRARLAAERQPA
ncbi:MAG: hypothetical protein M3464_07420 [Chloroflexota bacterium]|nr:hypothetical protein [Chloroflexota bacterium]